MAKRKTKIDQCREKIDQIDGRIVELLDDRAQLAREIGAHKKRGDLPFYDPGRQRRVLQKVVKRGSGHFVRSGLETSPTRTRGVYEVGRRRVRPDPLRSRSAWTSSSRQRSGSSRQKSSASSPRITLTT